MSNASAPARSILAGLIAAALGFAVGYQPRHTIAAAPTFHAPTAGANLQKAPATVNEPAGRMSTADLVARLLDRARSSFFGNRDFSESTARLLDSITSEQAREMLLGGRFSTEPEYYLLPELAACWAQADPKAVLAWAGHLPPKPQGLALFGTMRSWAEADPAAARRHAEALPRGSLRNRAIAAVAQAWAEQDTQAALGILFAPGNSPDISTAAEIVARQAGRHLDQALQTLEKNPDLLHHALAEELLIAQLKDEDPSLAAELALTFPASHYRQLSLHNTAAAMVAERPTEAVAWILDHVAGATDRTVLLNGAFDRLTAASPTTAIAEFAKLDDNARFNAVTSVAERWARSDTTAAATWATSLADAPLRRRALDSVIRTWTISAPSDALGFVCTHASPEDQAMLAGAIAEQWPARRSAEAAAAMANLPAGPVRDAFSANLRPAAGPRP